jgi:hypothetical protein
MHGKEAGTGTGELGVWRCTSVSRWRCQICLRQPSVANAPIIPRRAVNTGDPGSTPRDEQLFLMHEPPSLLLLFNLEQDMGGGVGLVPGIPGDWQATARQAGGIGTQAAMRLSYIAD